MESAQWGQNEWLAYETRSFFFTKTSSYLSLTQSTARLSCSFMTDRHLIPYLPDPMRGLLLTESDTDILLHVQYNGWDNI